MIAVQPGAPAAICAILTRVMRHDGGQVAFDESSNNNYTKSIALEPGQYRLRTDVTPAGRPTARAAIGFQVGTKPSR